MAKDSITRLKAQILAEAGVPLGVVAVELSVARRSLQRWAEDGGWKTPYKINELFERLQLNDRLTNWMMGPKGPLRVRLMYDYLVAGAEDYEAAFSMACADADKQAEIWREGAVYPVPRAPLTEPTIAQSYRLQSLGIDSEIQLRQVDTVVKRTVDNLTQQELDGVTGVSNLRANVEEIGANWQESRENGGEVRGNVAGLGGTGNSPTQLLSTPHDNYDKATHPAGLIAPKSPHNFPTPASIKRSESSPLDVLLRPTEQLRQSDAPRDNLRQHDAPTPDSYCQVLGETSGCGTPVEDYVPTIGEKARAASILEVLPRDFEGFRQTVRDPEALSRAEAARAGAYRENISATMLKLSQYALQLAESDPRKALIVMSQISKMAQTANKTFKLDEEKDSNKSSDAMRRLAQKEEDGGDQIVLDV